MVADVSEMTQYPCGTIDRLLFISVTVLVPREWGAIFLFLLFTPEYFTRTYTNPVPYWHTHTHTHTHSHAQIHILHTRTQKHKYTFMQLLENTQIHTRRQTGRQAERKTDRQTDRQIDRQIERQIDRQTGRQADRHFCTNTNRGGRPSLFYSGSERVIIVN